MKFAKDLEENIVPEWRIKYIDYKVGKKKIKSVAKAVKYAQESPAASSLYINSLFQSRNNASSRNNWKVGDEQPGGGVLDWIRNVASVHRLSSGTGNQEHATSYGSIRGSPPTEGIERVSHQPPSLRLPQPLQPLAGKANEGIGVRDSDLRGKMSRGIQIGKSNLLPPNNNPSGSVTLANSRPALMRRVVSGIVPSQSGAIGTDAEDLREETQNEFFRWMESELVKIDAFYRMKEEEAVERLEELREQLHIMRHMRLLEIKKTHLKKYPYTGLADGNKLKKAASWSNPGGAVTRPLTGNTPVANSRNPANSLERLPPATLDFGLGNTENRTALFSGDAGGARSGIAFRPGHPGERDYAQRARMPINEITSRIAKRKLKSAIIEYYRGLELLKSYCHHNREAFRKINKKFDKVTGLRTSKRFMNEKVNKSYFGSSEVLDNIIHQTEDLFARYLEGGNRKQAVERLRTREKAREFYGSTFRSGIFLGLAAYTAIQGLYLAIKKPLNDIDDHRKSQHSYLKQIWAGFFLPLLFMLLFAVNCRTWVKSKINYAFCFEFDSRHSLDYRQFLEIPSFLAFIFGLLFWLNFENFWPDRIDPLYYPIIFLAIAVGVILAPFRILYHRSRRWLVYAHWRLLLSGVYPVEFRDFWLGDMWSSQTYTMGNIALASCLYSKHWVDPDICNSSNSKLLGFMTCIPGIWRILQCLRRYYDTQNAFPHLVNAGKYSMTVVFYIALSLWRMKRSNDLKAFFIAVGIINTVYGSVWDLAMDFSLLNPYAPWPFLRNELGFKSPYSYYAIIFLDPVLRFSWVFYIIFAKDIQHSQSVAFFVSLAEIIRRWIWCFFRMENEHCANVGSFRAYREVPLPYELPPEPSRTLMVGDMIFPERSSSPGQEILGDSPRPSQGTTNRPTALPDAHFVSPIDPAATPILGPSRTPAPEGKKESSHPVEGVTIPSSHISAANQPAQGTIAAILAENLGPDIEMQPPVMPASRTRRWSLPNRRSLLSTATISNPNRLSIPAMRWNEVGTTVSNAHTQDFERRRSRTRDSMVGIRSVHGKDSGSDEDDEDEEDEEFMGSIWSEGESDEGEVAGKRAEATGDGENTYERGKKGEQNYRQRRNGQSGGDNGNTRRPSKRANKSAGSRKKSGEEGSNAKQPSASCSGWEPGAGSI